LVVAEFLDYVMETSSGAMEDTN